MKSIYSEVMSMIENETTKISKKAFNVLNREGIADIIINENNMFWFESYSYGNDCSQVVYDYLKRFIKRKFNVKYLYEEIYM